MEPWFDEKEIKAVNAYMRGDGWITEFKKTEELEEKIAQYTHARFCIMTVNGTISLILALLALGLKSGDEVLVPDLTMIATPNAAKLLGVQPVLVDVEQDTLCMDLKRARDAITPRTKAILYVPLNGRSGNMKYVKKFCSEYNLYLIEDAAQTLGSYWNKKHLGTYGDIGTLSFSVPKIITTGQGGALLTNNHTLYHRIKRLKDFGRARGGIDIHDEWGWNFKFTDLQATIGLEQMKKLSSRIQRKRDIYKRYIDGLKNIKEIEFIPTNLINTSPWAIDIFVSKPAQLADYLKKKGIGSRAFYPPIHTQKIYHDPSYKDSFPVASKYGHRGLWLPSASNLTNQQVDYIITAISEYYNSLR